jgi:putative ABC transport system permease protein
MNVLNAPVKSALLAVGFRRSKVCSFSRWRACCRVDRRQLALQPATLAELISAIGIPMPPPPGMEEGYTGEIRITWPVLANAFAIAFVTTALAGLYPAWKASRLNIINALRNNI